MAESGTLLGESESIVQRRRSRGMPTLHCGCPSSHLTGEECWSATEFPPGAQEFENSPLRLCNARKSLSQGTVLFLLQRKQLGDLPDTS
jgi:hypothetical protein